LTLRRDDHLPLFIRLILGVLPTPHSRGPRTDFHAKHVKGCAFSWLENTKLTFPLFKQLWYFRPDFDGTKFSAENHFTMGDAPCKRPLTVIVSHKSYILNRQIGVADSKYVVPDDPYHPVTRHGACALPILPLNWPTDIDFIHFSATDQARSIKFGSKYASMDFYTNSAFKVQKRRALGSRDQISKFWENLIYFERFKLSASNLVYE